MDKTTTKIRPVFDGASRPRQTGKSLNDAVYMGPNLINRLTVVLTRFRKHKIAVGGDVAEMFLQIQNQEKDRQYQRFLFRERPEDPVMELEPTVHIFGNRGSPCVALYVIQTHAKENEQRYPRATEAVLKSSIVDDIMDSVETEEEAVQLFKDLKICFDECGMNIRKFISNSKLVLDSLPEEDRAKNIDMALGNVETAECPYPVVKTLGMIWLSEPDVFTFSYEEPVLKPGKKWTKRRKTALKRSIRIFDNMIRLIRSRYIIWRKGVSRRNLTMNMRSGPAICGNSLREGKKVKNALPANWGRRWKGLALLY